MTDAERIKELEEQVRWWVHTCAIKDDQYRALLSLIHGQREAAQRFAASFDPAAMEAYVNRMVPREG